MYTVRIFSSFLISAGLGSRGVGGRPPDTIAVLCVSRKLHHTFSCWCSMQEGAHSFPPHHGLWFAQAAPVSTARAAPHSPDGQHRTSPMGSTALPSWAAPHSPHGQHTTAVPRCGDGGCLWGPWPSFRFSTLTCSIYYLWLWSGKRGEGGTKIKSVLLYTHTVQTFRHKVSPNHPEHYVISMGLQWHRWLPPD
jgi:hypothetical protein